MTKQTESKIAISLLAIGVAGSILAMTQKKNINTPKEDVKIINMTVAAYTILGVGAGLVIGNAETIAQFFKKSVA